LGSRVRYKPHDKAEFARSEPIKADLDNAKLTIARSTESVLQMFEHSTVDQAVVIFELKEPLTIQEWHDLYFHPLTNLLTLATGHPSGREAQEFWPLDDKSVEAQGRSIKVIERNFYSDTSEESSLQADDMPFMFKDIATEWVPLIQNWFALTKLAGPAVNVFFSVDYQPRTYIEQVFSSLVQALEAFHRFTECNFDLPETDHDKRKQEILESTPPPHVKWLGERLQHSNEPSLRKRLKQLIKASGEVVTPFVTDVGKFLTRVVDTRNYLVHRDRRGEEKAIKSSDLWGYCFVLSLVMRAALLRKIMGDPNRANVTVTQTPEYRFQMHRLRLP